MARHAIVGTQIENLVVVCDLFARNALENCRHRGILCLMNVEHGSKIDVAQHFIADKYSVCGLRLAQEINDVAVIIFAFGLFAQNVLIKAQVLIASDAVKSPFATTAQVIENGFHATFVQNNVNRANIGIGGT